MPEKPIREFRKSFANDSVQKSNNSIVNRVNVTVNPPPKLVSGTITSQDSSKKSNKK